MDTDENEDSEARESFEAYVQRVGPERLRRAFERVERLQEIETLVLQAMEDSFDLDELDVPSQISDFFQKVILEEFERRELGIMDPISVEEQDAIAVAIATATAIQAWREHADPRPRYRVWKSYERTHTVEAAGLTCREALDLRRRLQATQPPLLSDLNTPPTVFCAYPDNEAVWERARARDQPAGGAASAEDAGDRPAGNAPPPAG